MVAIDAVYARQFTLSHEEHDQLCLAYYILAVHYMAPRPEETCFEC